MTSRPWFRRIAIALAIVAVAAGAHGLRTSLGLPTSPAALREVVAGFGWWGPLAFLGVMSLRTFLALPSALLLTVAGLCFGVGTATTVGAVGLVLSGLLMFAIARWLGRDWVARHEGGRAQRLEERIHRLGPTVIGISTAHPIGVLTPFHCAAGLSALPVRAFALALVLGSPVRALAYAVFGAALTEPESPAFLATTVGLGAVTFLPLLVPGVRRRVFPPRA